MPAPELQRCRILDITYRDDRTNNLADLERLLLTGEPFRIRKRYVRPTGKLVWVENHVSLFRDGNGPARLTASIRMLPAFEMQGSFTPRPILQMDDLAPHLRTALREALIDSLEKAAARGEYPTTGGRGLGGFEGDALVRIANRLMEAHDATALDCDPATCKLIEAVLLHVGLRLTEDVDPLQFGGAVN